MNEVLVSSETISAQTNHLRSAAELYDIDNYPGLEHLRPHQLETLDAIFGYVVNITPEELEQPEGACILMPPGSGKTISACSMITALTTPEYTPRVLHLVPSLTIQRDTLEKFATFAPDIDVSLHEPKLKNHGDVCLMLYQGLKGAMDSGFIERFNPDIVVSDEAHHVIDGDWAQRVEKIAVGRLNIGMTATPAYNHVKNVRRLFPKVLIHKTFVEGVKEGFVSAPRGTVYTSNIRYNGDNEGLASDIFSGLNIAQQYAEIGQIGIVSCIGGQSRAHARAVESLAKLFKVGEEQRPLRVFSIDGEMNRGLVRDRVDELKAGEIDAIAYTSLLNEGFDMPELDYMVLLAWTNSMVRAAQRIGRATRLGKTTDVFEFHRPGYVSHRDAFLEEFRMDAGHYNAPQDEDWRRTDYHGFTVNAKALRPNLDEIMQSSRNILDTNEDFNPVLESTLSVEERTNQPTYAWLTKEQIAAMTQVPVEQVEVVLSGLGFISSPLELGKYHRDYYAPEAMPAFLTAVEAPLLPEETHIPLLTAYKHLKDRVKDLGSLNSFKRLLAQNDIEPKLYADKANAPVLGVPLEALKVVPELSKQALRGLTKVLDMRSKLQDKKLPKKVVEDEVALPESPAKPLEERVEDFLFSLGEQPGELQSAFRARQRMLANLQEAVRTARAIPANEVKALEEKIAKEFKPDSIVSRNLQSMGERAGIPPARVLAAIMRIMLSHLE